MAARAAAKEEDKREPAAGVVKEEARSKEPRALAAEVKLLEAEVEEVLKPEEEEVVKPEEANAKMRLRATVAACSEEAAAVTLARSMEAAARYKARSKEAAARSKEAQLLAFWSAKEDPMLAARAVEYEEVRRRRAKAAAFMAKMAAEEANVARYKEARAAAVARYKEAHALEGSAAKEVDKLEEGGKQIVRLPDWYIKRIQDSGVERPRPLPEGFLDYNPKLREMVLACKEAANASADVKEDILMQVAKKGYAEVMMERIDGVLNYSITPKA